MRGAEHAGGVLVPGFTDGHTHLLKAAARVPFPWEGTTVAGFHTRVASEGSTPMDTLEPPPAEPLARLAALLHAGLRRAAATGLVEVTEMGMRQWWYLDALNLLQRDGGLPARVRIYLASGLAEQASLAELGARRDGAGPWVSLEGVKFYADGWLGPRTCALCRPFADAAGSGLLFMSAPALARRIEPFAGRGWRIATHAIGDRGVETVLDAYELAWAGDLTAIAGAAPRVEHASVQSGELTSRIAALGVVACIQPSFALSDLDLVGPALGPDRQSTAYPWRALASSGARLVGGSDYPIEVMEPLVGLARLVNGRSLRPGFGSAGYAPAASRLPTAAAFGLLSDQAAGGTRLSADPRRGEASGIDLIEVLGTAPRPFG